jgi:hypothetical protein
MSSYSCYDKKNNTENYAPLQSYLTPKITVKYCGGDKKSDIGLGFGYNSLTGGGSTKGSPYKSLDHLGCGK